MKQLTILLLVMISLTAGAQISKGTYYLGGSINFYRNDIKPENNQGNQTLSHGARISPSFGKFINDKWLVVGYFGLGTDKYDYSIGGVTQYYRRSSSYSAGLLARYFIGISNNFYLSLNNRLRYARSNEEQRSFNGVSTFTSSYKRYTLGFEFSPTFVFFPSTRWALEGGLGSVYITRGEDLSGDSISFDYGLNLGSINFGVGYFFTR